MNEQSPLQINRTESQPSLSRRKLLLAAGAAAISAGSAGLGIKKWRESSPSQTEDNQPIAEIKSDETEALLPTVSLDVAEHVQYIAEHDGKEGLEEFFGISKEQFGTPSLFAEEFAKRAEAWMLVDCTSKSNTLSNTGEDLVDTAAITALAGENAVDQADGDLNQLRLFTVMTEARSKVREYYLNNIVYDDESPTTDVQVVGAEIAGQDAANNLFDLAITFKCVIEGKKSGVLTIEAPLTLRLDINRTFPNYHITQTSGDITFIHGKAE